MKTKKLFARLAIILFFVASPLVAEESGVFGGNAVGYGTPHIKILNASGDTISKKDYNGITFAFIAGYKQFFTPNFGLRYYINVNTIGKDVGQKFRGTLMDYGVNIDMLYNFIARPNANLGFFLGAGAGANTWGKDIGKDIADSKNVKKTAFSAGLNFGLRSVFAKHYGLEIAARVPFTKTTIFDGDNGGQKIKMTGSYDYNVELRYIFNF